jgi:hypothetical protein
VDTTWSGSNGGADWRVTLASDLLLPGRIAEGTVAIRATRDLDARGLVATLRGEERWRHMVSTGKNTTVVTSREDLPPVPVIIEGPLTLRRGEERSFPLSIPVPPLGPATLDATEAALEWSLEVKLDRANAADSAIEVPVRVAQPTALLRAGVERVEEFALYEAADAQGGGVAGSIELDPVPLVAGERFRARLVLEPASPLDLREVRVEVRVQVRCTVSGGTSETFTPFAASVAGPGRLEGSWSVEFEGALADRMLPTITLPHGKASAEVHVILARRLARDPHLVRDVAIATTAAL